MVHDVSRRTRIAALTMALALLAALVGASAASANPDVDYTTTNPDLRSVSLTDQIATYDGIPNRVRYCFDQPLGSIDPEGADAGDLPGFEFYIEGYDSDRVAYDTGGANIDPNATQCVVVDFPDEVDLSQMTIGGVDRDAVRRVGANNSSAAGNAPDNYPLGGSANNTAAAAGRTEGPDLIGVQIRGDVNEIIYTFDEALQPLNAPTPGLCTANQFGYYTIAGAGNGPNQGSHNGDTCSLSGNRATVAFTTQGANPDDVNQAVRIFVAAGGTEDLAAQGAGEAPGAATNFNLNPTGENDAATNSPDLVDARRVNATQVDFVFDEPVNAFAAGGGCQPGGFRLHQEDSRMFTASQCTFLQSDPRIVRATFPNSSRINAFDYVLGAVDEDTVGGTSQGEGNTVGADPIATSVARPGFTDGPDLVGTGFNTDTDEVAYLFDENIDDDAATVLPCHFFVVDPNGVVDFDTAAGSTQLSGLNGVIVRFAFDVDRRVAAGYVFKPRTNPAGCGRVGGPSLKDAADADGQETSGETRNIAGFTAASGPGLGGQTGGPSGGGTGGGGAGGGTGTTPIVRVLPSRVSLTIRPRRDRTAPFRFRFSGRVTPPRTLTRSDRCSSRGIVSVQTKIRRKTISTRRTRLKSNCTYAVRLTVRDRVRVRQARRAGKLRVRARFLGNRYMLPRSSARKSARTR